MTQQDTIDRLAVKHGRVRVDDGFEDGSVTVTDPDGFVWRISPEGVERYDGRDTSVDWSYA